jgi:2-methylcitrate dehydratase PrpD
MSGFACALAPELALAGFTAQEDAVEEALGKLVGDGFRPERITDGLGSRWEITRNYFRLHACCNPIHPALDCLREALDELRPQPGEIERIEFATFRFASVMRNPDPPNYFASKYSLPHAAAVMVARGGTGHGDIDDAALVDPVIAALRHRVSVSEDPAMTALLPRLKPARVAVRLKDGREIVRARESHRGDFNEPYPEADLRAKFRELAGHVLAPAALAKVEKAVDDCENLRSVRELIALMRGGH